jgi:hypothetical protein
LGKGNLKQQNVLFSFHFFLAMDSDILYAQEYAYHHLHWIQTNLCESFLLRHGASYSEIEMAQQHINERFMDLEAIWPQLTMNVRESLSKISFLKNVITTVPYLDTAILKLSNFSKLSMQERTKLLNVYFPRVKSNEMYEHNLHTVRLGQRKAVEMIGLMDMTNWKPWAKLLDALDHDIGLGG